MISDPPPPLNRPTASRQPVTLGLAAPCPIWTVGLLAITMALGGFADGQTTTGDSTGATAEAAPTTGEAGADPLQPRFPEAEPMVLLMRSIRDQDPRAFRASFSRRVQLLVPDEADWRSGLAYYTRRFAAFCGRVDDLEDVTFMFVPKPTRTRVNIDDSDDSRPGDRELPVDTASGEIVVIYQGREQFRVNLVREAFDWRVDEK